MIFSERRTVAFKDFMFALGGPERMLCEEIEALDLAVRATGESCPTKEQVREALEGLRLVPAVPVMAPRFELEAFLYDYLPDDPDERAAALEHLSAIQAAAGKLNEALQAAGALYYRPSNDERIDPDSIMVAWIGL